MTLIDSNILIDIWTDDPNWAVWSEKALNDQILVGEIAINPIIQAELAIGFKTETECEAALQVASLICLDLPSAAAYPASVAYRKYRRRGGVKKSTLPDFFIGAHADLLGIPLLTRDPGGYQSYFPNLNLISP